MLLLHGGQQQNVEPVENKHASWWRMALMARSLRRFGRQQDISVSLLQYAQRGWNSETDPAPVRDARWALDQLTSEHPGVPVVLVGHSMGGRTACRAADDPAVIGVVGLAPWLPPGEPNRTIAGRHLRVLHGTADRWTSPAASKAYVERSRGLAASASWTAARGRRPLHAPPVVDVATLRGRLGHGDPDRHLARGGPEQRQCVTDLVAYVVALAAVLVGGFAGWHTMRRLPFSNPLFYAVGGARGPADRAAGRRLDRPRLDRVVTSTACCSCPTSSRSS